MFIWVRLNSKDAQRLKVTAESVNDKPNFVTPLITHKDQINANKENNHKDRRIQKMASWEAQTVLRRCYRQCFKSKESGKMGPFWFKNDWGGDRGFNESEIRRWVKPRNSMSTEKSSKVVSWIQQIRFLAMTQNLKPGLFGLTRSNRDFTQAEYWGKNQFNSSFPASLCCFLASKELSAVYIKLEGSRIERREISVENLFGPPPHWSWHIFFLWVSIHAISKVYYRKNAEHGLGYTQKRSSFIRSGNKVNCSSG